MAQQCADRFGPVVTSRNIELSLQVNGDDHPHVAAAPEWLDRLIGVLLDNATRYAKSPGRVVISVESSSGHVSLTVADEVLGFQSRSGRGCSIGSTASKTTGVRVQALDSRSLMR